MWNNKLALWLYRIANWLVGKILCKLGKHNQIGPYPIGDPGNMRFICLRCKRVLLVSGNTTYEINSPDDPLRRLLEAEPSAFGLE